MQCLKTADTIWHWMFQNRLILNPGKPDLSSSIPPEACTWSTGLHSSSLEKQSSQLTICVSSETYWIDLLKSSFFLAGHIAGLTKSCMFKLWEVWKTLHQCHPTVCPCHNDPHHWLLQKPPVLCPSLPNSKNPYYPKRHHQADLLRLLHGSPVEHNSLLRDNLHLLRVPEQIIFKRCLIILSTASLAKPIEVRCMTP